MFFHYCLKCSLPFHILIMVTWILWVVFWRWNSFCFLFFKVFKPLSFDYKQFWNETIFGGNISFFFHWLYIGQDVMSVGLAGGLYGGLLCASALLNRNLYNDLQALQKELKKSEDTEKKQKWCSRVRANVQECGA